MLVKSVFPHCVQTMHILPNLVTYEACIEVVTRSALVCKVSVAPTEYRAHEACIEVATRSTTVYKEGVPYISIVFALYVLVIGALLLLYSIRTPSVYTRTRECRCHVALNWYTVLRTFASASDNARVCEYKHSRIL